MKWYLIIGGIFLIGALGAVVYVWALYQDTQRTFDAYIPSTSQAEKKDNRTAPASEGGATSTATEMQIVEPIEIDTATLGGAQQEVLKTFGYDNQTITITPKMVMCAQNAVGKERLDEITRGAAPTPFEAAKMLPCFSKD